MIVDEDKLFVNDLNNERNVAISCKCCIKIYNRVIVGDLSMLVVYTLTLSFAQKAFLSYDIIRQDKVFIAAINNSNIKSEHLLREIFFLCELFIAYAL